MDEVVRYRTDDVVRYRVTHEPDSLIRCRIFCDGKMTIPHVEALLDKIPVDTEAWINVSWIEWYEPSTDQDRMNWAHSEAKRENSHREYIKKRYHELFGGTDD